MPNAVAQLLETYGGWGLSTVLLATIWRLLRYIAEMHRQREADAAKVAEDLKEETRETVTALVEVKNAMGKFGEAMDRLSKRLEKLED